MTKFIFLDALAISYRGERPEVADESTQMLVNLDQICRSPLLTEPHS